MRSSVSRAVDESLHGIWLLSCARSTVGRMSAGEAFTMPTKGSGTTETLAVADTTRWYVAW